MAIWGLLTEEPPPLGGTLTGTPRKSIVVSPERWGSYCSQNNQLNVPRQVKSLCVEVEDQGVQTVWVQVSGRGQVGFSICLGVRRTQVWVLPHPVGLGTSWPLEALPLSWSTLEEETWAERP